jgi:hypothetical protein
MTLRGAVVCILLSVVIAVKAAPCDGNPCPSGAPCVQVGSNAYTCQAHCSRSKAHSMWMGGVNGSTPRIFQVDQDSDLATGVVIDVPSFGTASGQWAACRAHDNMIIMASPSSASAVLVNLTSARVVKNWTITAFSDIACSSNNDRLFVVNSTIFDVYNTTSGLRMRTSVPTASPITQLLVSARWPNRLWLADSGSNVYVYSTAVNETFLVKLNSTAYRSGTTFDGYMAMDEVGQNLYLGYMSTGVLKLDVSGDVYTLAGDFNYNGLPSSQANTFRPVVDPFDQAAFGFFWAGGGAGGFRMVLNLTTAEVVAATFAVNNNIGVGNYVLEPFGFRAFETLTFTTYTRDAHASSFIQPLPYNPPGLSSKRMHIFAQMGAYLPCVNNGTCSNDVCVCPAGFLGSQCELSPCSPNATPCANGGTCVSDICVCPQGFHGAQCEIHTTSSSSSSTVGYVSGSSTGIGTASSGSGSNASSSSGSIDSTGETANATLSTTVNLHTFDEPITLSLLTFAAVATVVPLASLVPSLVTVFASAV